jgi:SOS-response transcriptional repressor LexA
MLTQRQKQCMDFISTYMRDSGGISPTLKEICAAMGFQNRSSAKRCIDMLVLRGVVRRLDCRHRALEVVPQKREIYFQFHEKHKRLVPWRAPQARKTA